MMGGTTAWMILFFFGERLSSLLEMWVAAEAGGARYYHAPSATPCILFEISGKKRNSSLPQEASIATGRSEADRCCDTETEKETCLEREREVRRREEQEQAYSTSYCCCCCRPAVEMLHPTAGAGRRESPRLDVTLRAKSSEGVRVESHRVSYIRQRQARHGYLGASGELHAGIVELLANEILDDLLEGSCREMDSVVVGLAAVSVRDSVS